MRLFIALQIPESVSREIDAFRQRMEQELPPARWVKADHYHLTLVFLGATDTDRVPLLEERLAPVFARSAPFELRVEGGGTFPPRRPARVAWLGVSAPAALVDLQRQVVACAGAALEKEPERRRFHAHVTLARPRRPWPRRGCEALRAAAARSFGEPFKVSKGILMKSELGSGGPTYKPLVSWAMEADG